MLSILSEGIKKGVIGVEKNARFDSEVWRVHAHVMNTSLIFIGGTGSKVGNQVLVWKKIEKNCDFKKKMIIKRHALRLVIIQSGKFSTVIQTV